MADFNHALTWFAVCIPPLYIVLYSNIYIALLTA